MYFDLDEKSNLEKYSGELKAKVLNTNSVINFKFPKYLTVVILFTLIIITLSLLTTFYVNKKVETSFIYIIAFFILISYFSSNLTILSSDNIFWGVSF